MTLQDKKQQAQTILKSNYLQALKQVDSAKINPAAKTLISLIYSAAVFYIRKADHKKIDRYLEMLANAESRNSFDKQMQELDITLESNH